MDFAKNKDVQMLGMLSMLILQTQYCTPTAMPETSAARITTQQLRPTSRLEFGAGINTSAVLNVPKVVGPVDYFNLTRAINGGSPSSPEWPRLPTIPPLSPPPALSNPSTSRGSWSSLFGPGGVRQFVQETFTKDGPQTPTIVLDSGMVVENVGRAGRTLSGGSGSAGVSGGSGRGFESGGVVVASMQQQQIQQKKGKQRRESAYAVLQPQAPTQNAQIGPRSLQQPQTGLEGQTLPAISPAPSTRSRSEIMPGPLKASLSFSSTSSGGSSSGTGGSGMKRSPLVPVENVDWGLRRRGGPKEIDKVRKRVVVFQEVEEDR